MTLGILQAEPLEPIGIDAIYSKKPQCPHVTLAWGVPQGKYPSCLGLVTPIYLEANCWNERIQAIRCRIEPSIPFELQVPHLTVSWAEGSKPKESTDMLIGEHESTPIGLAMPCRITWVPLQYQPTPTEELLTNDTLSQRFLQIAEEESSQRRKEQLRRLTQDALQELIGAVVIDARLVLSEQRKEEVCIILQTQSGKQIKVQPKF